MTTDSRTTMITSGTPTPLLPTNLQTVAEFEQWQAQHGYEGSYEFVRGLIIEKKETKQLEAFFIKFLNRIFINTSAFRSGDELFQGMDAYVDEARKRRPDLAYFTAEQVRQMQAGEHVATRFAIEILSDSESYRDVTDKIQDYFDAGAQLVWYIVPEQQKIYVYTSPDALRVLKGNDLLSAAPVVPDFEFVVANLFMQGT